MNQNNADSGIPSDSLRSDTALRDALQFADEGWQVWIDWYEARLRGDHRSDKIELAYVLYTKDVPSTATAWDANSAIKRLIDAASGSDEPPVVNWDFFVSYAIEDETVAREVVSVLESEGHSTIAQFKDFAVGANFVNEMNRGPALAEAGRVIALYSPALSIVRTLQGRMGRRLGVRPPLALGASWFLSSSLRPRSRRSLGRLCTSPSSV